MLQKIKKWLFVIFSVCGVLHLAACLPDMPPPQTYKISPAAVQSGTQHLQSSAPLYCKVGRGSALFWHNWYDFSDTMFTLYDGEHINVKISRMHGMEEMTVQALFDHDGQKLIFCPVIDAPPGQRIACASLYALDDDLHDGIKRTFDIPNAVRNGAITCAYQPTKLKNITSYPPGGN